MHLHQLNLCSSLLSCPQQQHQHIDIQQLAKYTYFIENKQHMKCNGNQRKVGKVDFHIWRELDTGSFHYRHDFLFPRKTLDFHQGRCNPKRTPLPKHLSTFQYTLWPIQRDSFVLLESLWMLTFELGTRRMADRRLLQYGGSWIGILRPIYWHRHLHEQM